jgi:hypothetical protein
MNESGPVLHPSEPGLSRVFASAVGPRHDVQVPVAGEFPHRLSVVRQERWRGR